MMEDKVGFNEYGLRQAKILLGKQKVLQKTRDILELSHKERERKEREFEEKFKLKNLKRLAKKKAKKPNA